MFWHQQRYLKKNLYKKKNSQEPGPISNRLRVPETVTLTRAGKLPFLLVQLSLSGLLLCVISLNLNIRKLMLFQDNKWCEHTVGGAPTLSEMAMALKLLCTPLNRPSPSYKTKVKYVLVWRLRKRWIWYFFQFFPYIRIRTFLDCLNLK